MTPAARQRIRQALDALGDAIELAMAEQATRPDDPERLLSVDEAAGLLDLARSTFYGLVADGSVRSLRVGSRRLIPASAITEFIERQASR